MIQLIIFDLWNTLAYRNTPRSTSDAMQEILGLRIERETFITIFEKVVQTKKWDHEEEAYALLCNTLGIDANPEIVGKIVKLRQEAEKQCKLFEHAESMLIQLKKMGYKTAILSNCTFGSAEEIKKQTTLLNHIDYPIFSFDCGYCKPDVRAYRYLWEETGYLPQECLMIGDSLS